MDEKKLQAKAEKYFSQGKWNKALESFQRLSDIMPANLRIRLKIAEILIRKDQPQDARILFRQIADLYTQDGQLHKAIAVNHRLLELDRNDREVQNKLAILYEKHSSGIQHELPQEPSEIEKTVGEICQDDITHKLSSLRKKLTQAWTQADWDKALLAAIALWRQEPGNLHWRVAIAHILQSLNRIQESMEVYFHVAQQLLREGKPLRAAYVQAQISQTIRDQESSSFAVNSKELKPEFLTLQRKGKELIRRIAIIYSRYRQRLVENSSTPLSLNPFKNRPGRSEIMEELLEDILVDPIDLGKIQPVPFLSFLPRIECEAFIEVLKPRKFSKGELIFEKNDAADSFMIIGEGSAGLFSQPGKEFPHQHAPLKILPERELLGMFGFLFDGHRHLNAFALEDVELLECSREDFTRLLENCPRFESLVDEYYKEKVLPPLFQQNPLFQNIPMTIQKDLACRFSTLQRDDGKFELKEGKTIDRLYFLREGMVDVFYGNLFKEKALTTIKPGHFIGEQTWLSGGVLPFGYRASGPVTLLTLSQKDLPEEIRAFLEKKEDLQKLVRQQVFSSENLRQFLPPQATEDEQASGQNWEEITNQWALA